MSNYQRLHITGACYFFTVVTWRRKAIFTDDSRIQILRDALQKVKQSRPFQIDAMVVLPDHLHCIWQMPDGDSDYSSRWREIKKAVSRQIDPATNARKERLIWQRRFWEHTIRDENDWQRHMDYIHYNPVKHGLVQHPSHWPWSSFANAVKKGWYPADWGAQPPTDINEMEIE
jgi:putative transposase